MILNRHNIEEGEAGPQPTGFSEESFHYAIYATEKMKPLKYFASVP